jgi:hypothetical protein
MLQGKGEGRKGDMRIAHTYIRALVKVYHASKKAPSRMKSGEVKKRNGKISKEEKLNRRARYNAQSAV